MYESIVPKNFSLDLSGLDGQSLSALEAFFHKASRAEDTARLLSALAIHRIATEGLFKPQFDTLTAYFKAAPDRLQVSVQTAFSLLYAATFYLAHHEKLLSYGFKLDGDFSKLRMAHVAANHHPVDEVLRAVCSMSYREFCAYAFPASLPQAGPGDEIDLAKDRVLLNGKVLFTARQIQTILNDGMTPTLIGVKSATERKAVIKFLEYHRGKLPKDKSGPES